MPDPHLSKVADQLQQLRTAFSRLPPKHHSAGSTYPFENFVIDDEWLELTGSVQGSVNHTLEVAFGSRHNGGPIEFKSHGPDLAAVVDVLSAHITGEGGENPILIKWIVDLHRAAVHAAEQDPSEDSKKRERKPSAKQEIINQEESTNANKKKKKAAAKARTKKAKERTEEDFLWDPLDLRPAKRNDSTVGRKPDPLLDKLTEFVEAISDPEVKRWRCIAHSSGCQHSQADPRSSLRVFSHAVDCSFLDPELVQRAAEASISRSLGAQIEALNAVETASKGKDDPQPSVYAEARATGREKRSLNFNHLVLQAVCGLSLPPSILDTKHWRSPTISIPSTSMPARNAPDSDLRAMLPQYELSGAYLGELLVHEMNANRAQDIFGRFSTGEEIVDEFRIQYTNYVRQVSPFDRYLDAPTPLQYWEKLSRHYDAQILALLGIKLYSVVPNSMAEERTVSNFTKLNAPDRGRQKASTLVHMTQIRQHAQREENQGSPAVAPTVRFRDMSDLLKSAGKVAIDLRGTNIPTSANAGDIVPVANGSDSVVHDFVVDAWEQEAGFDKKIEPAEGGAMDGFEVEAEGINLGEPLLLDLLSDEPVLGASSSGSASTKKRPAPVDTSASSAQGLRKKFAPELFKF